MKNKNINILSTKLVDAFLKNKIISPIPSFLTNKISQANKFRQLCESKIKIPVIGFKAGGTGIKMLKKLKEKEPFYASVYKHNFLNQNQTVKINKYNLGIELEVCYLIKKNFFDFKKNINKNNITKFISHMAACIEVVGYRQRKKGIQTLGDLSSDFGGNIKFLVGKKIKFKNINLNNLKTNISNSKSGQSVGGNTNTVYVNPLNSLKFILNKIQKDNIYLKKNFFVFTGSTVGVVPILEKGTFVGTIEKIGTVKARIV